ncbi:hypothetical protein [Micromonospora peucetia]|uniref:Uncharacterized protein n=1 Tax=Micromonospora peucetia TaxID=47871 RepID=A0ABZ1EH74_9ACTN|nr:hypothetical protein [Micromonospora peucetia]WSA33124.1 hypothetical protein OIE14_03335 [Micromonospora peucetia]
MSTEGVAGIVGLVAVIGIGYAWWNRDRGDSHDDGEYEEVWYEEWHYEEHWRED